MPKHPFTICTVDKDPVVRQTSALFPVEDIQKPESQEFFDNLIEAMIDFDGIGIAAVQVGVPKQVFIVDKQYVDDKYKVDDNHLVVINPRIASQSGRTFFHDEGCLSVPGVYGSVERSAKIRIKGYDRNGNPVDIKAKGWFAVILQHEFDHLQGTLFIDTAKDMVDADGHAL